MDYSKRVATIFKRDDIRGVYPTELDEELAFESGYAFAQMLLFGDLPPEVEEHLPPLRIVVGHDARLSSSSLAAAVVRGVESWGAEVQFIGLCSSEEIYFHCGREGNIVGGIMVTASHNPAEYNGMKFVLHGGAPLTGAQLAAMRQAMEKHLADIRRPAERSTDFQKHLLELSGWGSINIRYARARGASLKVVVSAGNGVGAVAFAPFIQLLEPQGFAFIMMEAEPDGSFPNGVPNPLLPEFMGRLAARVQAEGADLGIGFDGDADRAGFVDGGGHVLASAEVYTAVARYKLAHAGATAGRPVLMRNLCCSRYIVDAFREDDVEIVETPVGHGQIKQLMRHPDYSGRVLFAGEHSGHYFYPEFFSVDSGMMTSLTMLHVLQEACAAGTTLAALFDDYRRNYCWSGELNVPLPSEKSVEEVIRAAYEAVRTRFEGCRLVVSQVAPDAATGLNGVADYAAGAWDDLRRNSLACADLKVRHEGADGAGWWFVMRPSGNEPKLRLNVEAYGKDCTAVCRGLTAFLQEHMK